MPCKIYISRDLVVPPIPDANRRKMILDIVAENANDWTHFTHAHYKSIVKYTLLYKNGTREIFHYKGRKLYPLPFFDDFIVFREYKPEQLGYRNVYYHIKSGNLHYNDSSTREMPDGSIELRGEVVFTLPFYWRYLPKLFLFAFKKRMRKLIDEDNVLISERVKVNGFDNQACRPAVPEVYDLFVEFFGEKPLPEADFRFIDRSIYPHLGDLA